MGELAQGWVYLFQYTCTGPSGQVTKTQRVVETTRANAEKALREHESSQGNEIRVFNRFEHMKSDHVIYRK